MNMIYSMIPEDRYITRDELVHLTGYSDRRVRDEINKLRKNPDTVVISSSRGKGYKRPASVEEIRHYMWECQSRINDEQETVSILESAIENFRVHESSPQFMLDFGG